MPLTSAPIELNFYNDQDEVEKTYRRTRIPSYLLDMAINLQSTFADSQSDAPNTDALFDFIVEFYGNQFTREELKQKTDLVECMAVFQSIITRASALTREFAAANPSVPSPRKK